MKNACNEIIKIAKLKECMYVCVWLKKVNISLVKLNNN